MGVTIAPKTPVLDWFHVTMRLTVMKNSAKGLPADEDLRTVAENLESVKWYLWHGNMFRALELLHFIEMDLEMFEPDETVVRELLKKVREFSHYIEVNQNFITQLRGALSLWREDLDSVCGIDDKLGGQQAHGEKTTDALDQTRGAFAATDAYRDAQ